MDISLRKIGKRFRYEWIFKGVDYEFSAGKKYAILGSNGSGKSTLMKIICGHLTPSDGEISFSDNGRAISDDTLFQSITFAAPYIDLIEEFSLKEALEFHGKFKAYQRGLNPEHLLEILAFGKQAKNKEIRFFSSGMKQRVKLLLALASESKLVLLDEPTTNLDKQGMDWYLGLVEQYAEKKTIIVASNEPRDYGFCEKTLNILDYKSRKKI